MDRKFVCSLVKGRCISKRCNRIKFKRIFKNYGLQRMSETIPNLNCYKPASLGHVKLLSNILKCRINVWSNDEIVYSAGKLWNKPKIDVEYIENQQSHLNCSQIGHYVLKGRLQRSEIVKHQYPNNCLFEAISSQTGIQANRLRRMVNNDLRKILNKRRFKKCKSDFNLLSIIQDFQGGASYRGRSKVGAKKILDASQNGESHPIRQKGHPRGHASYLKATGLTDSVENYSKAYRGKVKTGFLSRDDQDIVAHSCLKTRRVRVAMEVLNELGEYSSREALTIKPRELDLNEEKLPIVQEWINGEKVGSPARFKDVRLVLKHFYDKFDDEKYNVFVLTFYPTM